MVLLSIFVYFFGIPAVEQFIRKEVLTVTTEAYPEKILPPAVTVVASNGSDYNWEALEKICGESKDIKLCIQENTRSLTETVHAELGFTLNESLMTPELWREDFTTLFYGRSYTLLYPLPLGNNWLTDDIILHVNTSDGLTRKIFIHDPKYFVISENSVALPTKMQKCAPRSGSVYYSLALREHRKLDTPHNPCVDDPDYSFTTCVKESLSRKTGCRLP